VSIPLSALVPRRVIFGSTARNLAFRGIRPWRIPLRVAKAQHQNRTARFLSISIIFLGGRQEMFEL
jgi:hypothetical protein